MIARELDRPFKLTLSDQCFEEARDASAVVGLDQRLKSFLGLLVAMLPEIQFGELLAGVFRRGIHLERRRKLFARLSRLRHVDERASVNQPGRQVG